MKEQQTLMNQLLTERTSRAVDRIFSQNNPEQINKIFSTLQNRIRNSSNQLRQVLYRKYQNLINCSDLLTSLYQYGQELNDINNKMKAIINETQIQPEIIEENSDIIFKIQTQINNHNYQQAIQQCIQPTKIPSRQQAYYLQYLQIQIIQKMEQYLLTIRLNRQIIISSINVLKKWLSNNDISKIKQVVVGRKGTLLQILYNNIKDCEGYLGGQEQISKILSTLFEHKLSNLRNCSNNEQIEIFFNNLLQICQQSNGCIQISRIFSNNFEVLQSNLILIFIQNDEIGLNFKYELYDRLTTSESFIKTLKQLQELLYPNGNGLKLIGTFQKLWNNYYHQLIDYIIQNISPLNQKLNNNSQNQQISSELSGYRIYNYHRNYQQTLIIRKNYQKKILPLIINNMNSLFYKGRNIDQIQIEFNNKMTALNKQMENYKIFENATQIGLRQIILINLLCQSYNRKCLLQQNLPWSSIYLQPPKDFSPYASIFYNQTQTLQSNTLSFQIFFIGYTTPYLKITDLPIMQIIIIKLLQQLQQRYINKTSQQRIKSTILKFKKQAQSISIHKELLSGIGRYIFGVKYEEGQLKIDESYKLYLNKTQKVKQIAPQPFDQAFDIGEKEKGEDMVSYGVKAVGNIISNLSFMKKK